MIIKMICPNCGKEYNERMTCCISCGADLVPYEHSSEQTAFEPLIPEAVREDGYTEAPREETAEKAGFVREIPGHSPVPAAPVPAAAFPVAEKTAFETEIPVRGGKTRVSVSGAARFAGSLTASALMLAFILLFSAAAAVRLATGSAKIAQFAERLDVMNLPAAETPIPADGYNVSEDATVQEAIYVMSQGTGLSREDIKNIYETSTIRSFMTDTLNGYAQFIRSGKIPEKLTSDKLKSVFSENLGVIDSALGKPLSQHDINLAFSEIDSVQPVLDKLSPSSLEAVLGGGGLAVLRLLSSLPAIVCTAALAAAMLPLLRALNCGNAGMLRWGGGTALIGGIAVSAAVFLLTIRPFSASDKLFGSIAGCAAEVIAPDLYRIGGALAAMGLIMLIWSATLKKSKAE